MCRPGNRFRMTASPQMTLITNVSYAFDPRIVVKDLTSGLLDLGPACPKYSFGYSGEMNKGRVAKCGWKPPKSLQNTRHPLKGAALGAHKTFCPSGFGSSLKGTLQKALLPDLASACLPVARRKGRGNFITHQSI